MNPKALIFEWVDAFNKGDADRIADFYAENAINHQVANEPVEGKEAIGKCSQLNFRKQR